MTNERCDLCGRPIGYFDGDCRAHVNRTGEGGGLDVDCDGNGFEIDVREALRAPKLRDALAEALDAWERLDKERSQLPPEMERVQTGMRPGEWTVRARPAPESNAPRIAELRKLTRLVDM